ARCSDSCSSSMPALWPCWSERSCARGGPLHRRSDDEQQLVATDDGHDVADVGAGIAPRLPAFAGDHDLSERTACDHDRGRLPDQRVDADLHLVSARPTPPVAGLEAAEHETDE